MGINLAVRSKPIKGGILKRPVTAAELYSLVQEKLAPLAAPFTPRFSEGDGELYARIYDAEESVDFSSPRPGVLEVSAKTSTAGPGYHLWLCDLLDRLATELGTSWQAPTDEICDETDYFHSRDKQRVYDEMHAFLRALASSVLQHSREGTTWHVAMPLVYRFAMPGAFHIQMGPRTIEWAQDLADGRGDPRSFWPWYEEGFGADAKVGLATVLMSLEVRWRPPIKDAERALLTRIDRLLSESVTGHSRQMPWREWQSIRGYLGKSDELDEQIATRAQEAEGPLIGYRREEVYLDWVPWRLRIPGDMDEAWTREGFEGSTGKIWLGVTTFRRPPGVYQVEVLEGFEQLPHPDQGVSFQRMVDEDRENLLIRSTFSTETSLLVLTCNGDPGEKETMLRISDSVRLER